MCLKYKALKKLKTNNEKESENMKKHEITNLERDRRRKILRGYLANYGEFRRRGETYYWEYEGRGIWGLTARIINRILNK